MKLHCPYCNNKEMTFINTTNWEYKCDFCGCKINTSLNEFEKPIGGTRNKPDPGEIGCFKTRG